MNPIPLRMERIRGRSPREGSYMGDRRIPEVARTVHRRARGRRRAAFILHHIELAAIGPGRKRFSKQPERRPESLPRGQLDARCDATRSEILLVLRRDLRRGVVAWAVV